MAPKQRRAFSYLPDYFRTPQNVREYTVADDPLYEPESASFIRGYIGSTEPLSEEDLDRVPFLTEADASADAYQLSIGTTQIDPVTGEYKNGAFYTDLINQISANGGLISDPNRLFSAGYYSWTPPIDYDRHINFASYFWTGAGDATQNADYMTREISGSQTYVYRYDGSSLVAVRVQIVDGLGLIDATGTVVEDASTTERRFYVSNGTSWVPLIYHTVATLPTDLSGVLSGTYYYPTRTGPRFQRPVMQVYSASAGRWIAQAVVVDVAEPEYPITGMLWEDSRTNGIRTIKKFTGSNWIDLVYTVAPYLSGIGTDQQYVYDISSPESGDDWSKQNWWRHFEDLSQYDRANLTPSDQAVRPILEFWNGVERFPGDTKTTRNQSPRFATYHIDPNTYTLVSSGSPSTIMEYKRGTGQLDPILNLNPTYNDLGTFDFDMTLDESVEHTGYRYFRDSRTGLFHSTWARAPGRTEQHSISNSGPLSNFFDVPKTLTSNPNHQIPTVVSRSLFVNHMTSVMQGQTNFFGNATGMNSYRWTKRDPIVGATIIDPEHSLLRIMATLQEPALDVPDTIREVCRDYVRVMFRFVNRMNQLWDQLALNDGAGTLRVTAAQAVDSILTMMFMVNTDTSAYSLSEMGTYTETRSFNGTATVVGGTKPIFIPASPAKIGVSLPYMPGSFTDLDGTTRLIGHDGSVINSFGDGRDQVWLELQNRFYAAIPATKKTETETESSRHNMNRLYVADVYSGYVPNLTLPTSVLDIVDNHLAITSPQIGVYFSRVGPSYAHWDGTNWGLTPVQVDDAFLNQADGRYYIFNDVNAVVVPTYNPGTNEYTTNEYRQIIRREFERWANENGLDYTLNPDFDVNNPFTWNYSSLGIEGHYKGIYRRLFRTPRPDARPWEIAGYGIEPDWWRTVYVPTSVAGDGTPRYAKTHSMWTDLRNGLVHRPLGITRPFLAMVAPVPVDANGELLDPIASGIVVNGDLDTTRISDGWTYGDGGPVEELFFESAQYGFAVAMAGYLMKPGVWFDEFWITGYRNVEPTRVWNGPHLIHKNGLVRPPIDRVPLHLSLDSNGNRVIQHGLNEWIAERLYKSGQDPIGGFAEVIANTSSVLAWKTAGFIDRNRTKVSTLNGVQIPYEDLHVVLHQSKPFRQEFCSGVMITREGAGFRVFGYDSSNPNFRIELPARSSFGGQTELRETVTLTKNQTVVDLVEITMPRTQTASDTATLAVLYNGMRVDPRFYSVTGPTQITLDASLNIKGGEILEVVVVTTTSNPSTQLKTFSIGSTVYSYFSQGTGQYEDVPYGSFFNNANEVINFMMSYGRFLQSRGWVFDAQEPTTGDLMDWFHGAKKFATWLQQTSVVPTVKPDPSQEDFDIFYYSPLRYRAKFTSEYGQPLNVESIQNGLYGIIDRLGQPMSVDATQVIRADNGILITPSRTFKIAGDNQIFGCRIYLTETQHVVAFSNTTKFNRTIYDPLFALWYKTLYVDSYRTNDWVGRVDAPGFIISGGTLFPNFEKQAFDFTRYYSRVAPVNDPVKDEQAKNLVGYYPLDAYMDPLLADQRSRFDYYRGMIKAKGTVRAVMAFAQGTLVGAPNLEILEDWAWKMSEYGDSRRSLVQFRLNKTALSTPIQIIRFGVEYDRTSQHIEVPDLNRSELSSTDTPWLIPPVPSESGLSKMRFPLDRDGNVDTRYKYQTNLFDTATQEVLLSTFIFDPARGLFEPDAYSLIEYVTFFDPALYNTGAKASYSNNTFWGPEQVGKLWFSPLTLRYFDYHNISDIDTKSKFWGVPLYFIGSITRTGQTATVGLTDAITGLSGHHGVPINTTTIITVSGADQDAYNGRFLATATSATQFTYTVAGAPTAMATGNIRIDVNELNVWEWVESPVPPSKWSTYVASLTGANAPGGYAQNAAQVNVSYSQVTTVEANGTTKTLYYFWVRNNPGTNPIGKPYTSLQIEQRLRDPTSQGIPWMAIPDDSTMLVYLGGQTLTATSGLEISIDGRTADTHVEWALVTEGSRIMIPPREIWNKIKDSISGVDAQGNVVPYAGYTETEKYGTDFYPAQTVFVDSRLGFGVWKDRVNRVFAARDFSEDPSMVGHFLLEDEYSDSNPTGYWKRGSYLNPDYATKTVVETVGTISERDYRAGQGYYMAGDLVRVQTTTRRDAWTGDATSATYVYDGTTFTEVGSDNSTVVIMDHLYQTPSLFRTVMDVVYDLFEHEENSTVLIGLFHEILRQSPDCDWCFKTSYITAHITDRLRQSAFIHPDQTTAIYNNIIDVKPFRTKFRSETITYGFSQDESVDVHIEEDVEDKITLLFDRRASSTFEDGGYDTHAYEGWPWGYDRPLWELADFGRGEYVDVGTITGDGTTTQFVITPRLDPVLYQTRSKFYVGDVLTDLSTLGNSVTISVYKKTLVVTFAVAPLANHHLVVSMNVGFVQGNPPTLVDTNFTPFQSDYQHLSARLIAEGRGDEAATLTGADMDDTGGGHTEERVRAPTSDGLLIGVRMEWSGVMGGWGGSPYDTTPWDEAPADIGERVFFVAAGETQTYAPGISILSTSEDITVGSSAYVVGSTLDPVVAVYRSHASGPFTLLTPGTDYTTFSAWPNIIQLTAPVPGDVIRYVYNGFLVGALGTFEVLNAPGNYDISDGALTLTTPVAQRTITLKYLVPRYKTTPLALLCRNATITDDIMSNHLVYDSGGFESNRPVGTTHVNTTNSHQYQWTGSTWTDLGAIAGGTVVFVKRLGQFWQNNSPWELVYEIGDTYGLPVLDYPAFGAGILSGTYQIGQLSDASTEFPAAYQVVQHPGTTEGP